PQPDPVGEGCCTIVVRPGESIQDAINALPPQGGCICIKAGVHPVPGTLTLNRANVHMHGESPGAILQGAAPLLQLGTAAQSIRIEMLDFLARVPTAGSTSIISAGGADDLTISDCRISPFPGTSGGIAIQLTRTDRARITDNAIFNTDFGIVVNGLSTLPEINRNGMVFGLGLEQGPASTGIWIASNPSANHIRENVILGAHQGIVVNDAPFETPRSASAATMIHDNAILTGVQTGNDNMRARGIDAASDFSTVRGNNVVIAAVQGQGIRVTGAGSTVTDNKVTALARGEQPAIGLQIGHESESAVPPVGIIARDNQFGGAMTGILLTQCSGTVVQSNHIVTVDDLPAFGILSLNASAQRLENNTIAGAFGGIVSANGRDTRIEGNDVIGGLVGLFLTDDTRPTISGNRLAGCRGLGAIGLQTIGRTEFCNNRITNAGSALSLSVALGAFLVSGELVVDGNEITDTGVPLDGDGASTAAWGIYGDLILEARVQSNFVSYSDMTNREVGREDRALIMRGLLEFRIALGRIETILGYAIQILDNKFVGTGASALVQLAQFPVSDNINIRFERVFFSNNYCMHLVGSPDDRFATVVLLGRACTVMGNHVKASLPGYFSFDFNGMRGPYVGNVTSGPPLGYNPFVEEPAGDHNFIS
ncbi:MAG: right-handed parallel beta-helix repeat-containing protein, partial [Sulfitobacter sp.]